jgi:hypothetical protein
MPDKQVDIRSASFDVVQHLADALVAAADSDGDGLDLSFVRRRVNESSVYTSTVSITGVIADHATVHANGPFMSDELRQIATHLLAAATALDMIREREAAAFSSAAGENSVNDDVAVGRISRPDVISGVDGS